MEQVKTENRKLCQGAAATSRNRAKANTDESEQDVKSQERSAVVS